MAYQTFKDILGETSLERKCRFLFGLCLLVLITGSFWWYGSSTESLVYATTRSTGRHLVDAIMLQYHWKTLEKEQQYTSLIETLGRTLQSQPYSWRLLDPDATPEERAETRMWVRRIDLHVCEPMANGFRWSEGLPMFGDRVRCIPEAAAGLKLIAQERLAWIDGLIGGQRFICGERLTLADFLLFGFLEFGTKIGQPFSRDLSTLPGWFDAMAARPSVSA
jgi:hypothetical protein